MILCYFSIMEAIENSTFLSFFIFFVGYYMQVKSEESNHQIERQQEQSSLIQSPHRNDLLVPKTFQGQNQEKKEGKEKTGR